MKTLLIFLWLAMLIGCGDKENDSYSTLKYDEIPGDYRDTAALGNAYSKMHKKLLNMNCVTGNPQVRGNSVGELRYEKNMSVSQIMNQIGGSIASAFPFPPVNVHLSLTTAIEQAVDTHSQTHHIFWVGTNRKSVFSPGTARISDQASKFKQAAPERLVEVCGDEFVSEIQYGASLIATLRLDFVKKEDKAEVESKLGLDIPDGKFKLDGQIKTVSKAVRNRTRVTLLAKQFGGDPAGLFKILPDNMAYCTLENIDQCLMTMNQLVIYAKSDFHASLLQPGTESSGWNVVKYITQRYSDSGLIELAPSADTEIPLEVKLMRQDLERKYLAEMQLMARIDRLLSNAASRIDNGQLSKIYEMQKKVSNNITILRDVQHYCLDNIEGCSDYSKKWLAELNQYSEKDLELDFQDSQFEIKYDGATFGGKKGRAFDDRHALKDGVSINRITLQKDGYLQSMVLDMSDGTRISHGGSFAGGKGSSTINLSEGEYVTRMDVHVGKPALKSHRVFFIRIYTSEGQVIESGRMTKNTATITAPSGMQILGFFGRQGDRIDKIGAIFATARY
ncbi:MAG: hypothetical protein HQK54_04610 [Oligoflexales bacterium]|nr:hypothetical protein [Oligoflexales bacterium]